MNRPNVALFARTTASFATVDLFYSETPGRRSKLPSLAFDGQAFVIDNGEIRLATYKEVMAARKDFKAFKAP